MLSAGVTALAGLAGLLAGLLNGNVGGAVFLLGVGLMGAGLAILLFFAGLWAAKASAKLGGALAQAMKKSVIGKGATA